jgi:hypothetical protein
MLATLLFFAFVSVHVGGCLGDTDESSRQPDPSLSFDVVAQNPQKYRGDRVRWYGQLIQGEVRGKTVGTGSVLNAVFVDPSTDLRVTSRTFGVEAESHDSGMDLMLRFQEGPGWVTGTVGGTRKVKITVGPPPIEKEVEVPVLTDAKFEPSKDTGNAPPTS